MKIIHKYIFKELLKIFILSSLFLTLILFVDKILFLTEMVINRGVTFWEVTQMMFFISPVFMGITIPISVLLSVVVVFNQLSADNEFVVMKASGWSFMYLMRPVLFFSLAAYLLTNAVVFYLLPWGNQSFKELVYKIVETRANVDIKPQVFNRDFKDLVIFIKDKSSSNHLKGVFIAQKESNSESKIILSNEGIIISEPDSLKIRLKLKSGTIHETNIESPDYQTLSFDSYDLNLDLPSAEELKKKGFIKPREMSPSALLKRINEKKAQGGTAFIEEVELSKKFSIPITCLLFGLLGAPFGIKSSRSGKSGGFVIAVVIILIYYVLLVSMENLGATGQVPALFSVWVPNILLIFLTVYVCIKTQRESPFSLIDKLNNTLNSLKMIFFNRKKNRL